MPIFLCCPLKVGGHNVIIYEVCGTEKGPKGETILRCRDSNGFEFPVPYDKAHLQRVGFKMKEYSDAECARLHTRLEAGSSDRKAARGSEAKRSAPQAASAGSKEGDGQAGRRQGSRPSPSVNKGWVQQPEEHKSDDPKRESGIPPDTISWDES